MIRGQKLAVFVGRRVSLAHQALIHAPAQIGEDTFIGMKALVFRASVGNTCVVEPGCILMGVSVAAGYIKAQLKVTEQKIL